MPSLNTDTQEKDLLTIHAELNEIFQDRRANLMDNETARVLVRCCSKKLMAIDLLLRVRQVVVPDTFSEVDWLALIDRAVFANGENPMGWEGSGAELETILTGTTSPVRIKAREHIRHTSAMGQALGVASKAHPDRIHRRILNGYTIWMILPPEEAEAEEPISPATTTPQTNQ